MLQGKLMAAKQFLPPGIYNTAHTGSKTAVVLQLATVWDHHSNLFCSKSVTFARDDNQLIEDILFFFLIATQLYCT